MSITSSMHHNVFHAPPQLPYTPENYNTTTSTTNHHIFHGHHAPPSPTHHHIYAPPHLCTIISSVILAQRALHTVHYKSLSCTLFHAHCSILHTLHETSLSHLLLCIIIYSGLCSMPRSFRTFLKIQYHLDLPSRFI
jgi:hypothetical protein